MGMNEMYLADSASDTVFVTSRTLRCPMRSDPPADWVALNSRHADALERHHHESRRLGRPRAKDWGRHTLHHQLDRAGLA
jgi:hypothetical protein